MSNTEVNRTVRVTLLPEGRAIAADNMNVIAILTDERGVLNSENRYMIVNPTEVAGIFGTYSKANEWALTVGATTPNATQVGGALVIGYHRSTDETIDEVSATLTGEQVDETLVINSTSSITQGSFTIEVDGVLTTVTDMNLSTAADLAGIVTALNTALDNALTPGAVVASLGDSKIILTGGAGTGKTLSALDVAGEGSPVSTLLGLSQTAGATLVQGADAVTLSPETRLEALTELKALVNFKGVVTTDRILDNEVLPIATWAEANKVLFYNVFKGSQYAIQKNSNPCWQVRMAGLKAFRMLWGSDRKLAVAYMARMHTVNFNGENTAITMNLKELPIVAEPIGDDLWVKLKNIGLDVYTTTKGEPNVLCSNGNGFVDNEYNLTAFVDSVQTDVFNLLKTTPTKIAQTERDGAALVDTAEKTSRRFARANVIGAGEWTNPATFDNVDVFKRAIRLNGFHWMLGSFADQPAADRQNRIAPVLQGAIKNAGAIHEVDVIILFNA